MRPTAAQRGYGAKWRSVRAVYLRLHPQCVDCLSRGLRVPASVVDHIQPHRGDPRLFWDAANWQALCAPCHDRHKALLERSGKVVGCTPDGMPVDPGHHWKNGGAGSKLLPPAGGDRAPTFARNGGESDSFPGVKSQ